MGLVGCHLSYGQGDDFQPTDFSNVHSSEVRRKSVLPGKEKAQPIQTDAVAHPTRVYESNMEDNN